jgi:hypothetical protein
MKHVSILIGLLLGFNVYSKAQIQFEYENKDDIAYTFKMRIGEKRTSYTFEAFTKKEVVVETPESIVYLASKCPEVPVTAGARIKIENGCLSLEKK